MKHTNNFEKQANTAYKLQVDSLSNATLHRLKKGRETALSYKKETIQKQSRQKKHQQINTSIFSLLANNKWLTGAGASLAFASVLTFMIIPNLMHSNTLSPLDDIEMLSAETDLDLVTDLEFYQWLDDSAISQNTL